MGAGSGGSTGRGPATRQWIAAALVLAAIPAGVAAGVIDSSEVAAWGLAGSALAAAVVLFAGSPTGGAAAPLWRLLALGVGLWGGALAAIASSYDEVTAVPIPSAADVPLLGGLFIIGVAAVLMALARTWRDDNIARIDAAIVGIGVGVVLAAFLWPELREEDLPRGGLLLAAAVGRRGLLPRRRRGAPGDHRRLPPGRWPVHDRGGAGHRRRVACCCAPRQFGLTGSGAARVGIGLSVAGLLGARRCGRAPVRVADRRAGAASCARPRPRPARRAHAGHGRRTDLRHRPAPPRRAGRTGSCSVGSPRCCSSSWPCGWSWSCARARPRRSAR